jgi:DNA mismatch repair protein MutL
MAARIRKLDPLVSIQIAAGEVVERPASVVKELLENSLDAGARRIVIDFEDSGLSLIRVSDDGSGMPAEDAPISLERFATSKLSEAADLSRVSTLGFRGEALPSIAACSRITLETREAASSPGTRLRSLAGQILTIEEKGLPQGTTVTVNDLFFNTPARLKFMKSRSRERQAIVDVVQRLALAWPEVAFTLRSGGNVVLRTSGQGLRNAVADIFGPSDAALMAPVDSPAGVRGFTGLPALYRRQRDRQLFSVNARPVRNTALGWALDVAFEGLLPPKCYAVAVLDVSLPAEDVDVNVHPTKAEVKFSNDREVGSGVTAAVRETLNRAGFGPVGTGDRERGTLAAASWSRPYGPSVPGLKLPRGQGNSGQVHWGLLRDLPQDLALLREGPGPHIPEGADGSHLLPEGWQFLGSIVDTYLVAQTPSSLLVVDKHALMESLTFRALISGESGSQDLLVAEMLHLSPQEALAYEEHEAALEAVGFVSRQVGDRTAMVTRVPLILGKPLEPRSLKDVLSRLADRGESAGIAGTTRILEAARMETSACHASVRAREPLSREEACALLRELYEDPGARNCPHGRPAVKELPLKDLDDFFGRTPHTPGRRV